MQQAYGKVAARSTAVRDATTAGARLPYGGWPAGCRHTAVSGGLSSRICRPALTPVPAGIGSGVPHAGRRADPGRRRERPLRQSRLVPDGVDLGRRSSPETHCLRPTPERGPHRPVDPRPAFGSNRVRQRRQPPRHPLVIPGGQLGDRCGQGGGAPELQVAFPSADLAPRHALGRVVGERASRQHRLRCGGRRRAARARRSSESAVFRFGPRTVTAGSA